MKRYAVLVVSALTLCASSFAKPPADMEEGDGYYGFQVRHRLSESVFDDLVRSGLPPGLEGIEANSEYNRIRIKGAEKAVDAVWRRLGELDSTVGARIVYHVRLQDVIATDEDLEKAGIPLSNHDTTWDDTTRQQIARDIQDAIRKGVLKATGASQLDIEEGHAVSLSTRRATIHRDPAFWEERPVPSFILMQTRLKPTMDGPSQPGFDVELKRVALNAAGKPFLPEVPEGEMLIGQVVPIGDGGTTILGAIMDEEHTYETGKKGEYKTEGIWRVVLATTTVEDPFEPGIAAQPNRPDEAMQNSVALFEADAPASAWRAAGIDPDVPRPLVVPHNSVWIREEAMATDSEGMFFHTRLEPARRVGALVQGSGKEREAPVYSVIRIRCKRLSNTSSKVWVDVNDVASSGGGLKVRVPDRHFHGDVMEGEMVVLCGRRLPGPGDRRRVSFFE